MTWTAIATGERVDPGTVVHVFGGGDGPPAAGDRFSFDGPGAADDDGVLAFADARQMLVDMRGGTRFAFRPRRPDEKGSGLAKAKGKDWLLLSVSPVALP